MKLYPPNTLSVPEWTSTKNGYPRPENHQRCLIVVDMPGIDVDPRRIIEVVFQEGHNWEGVSSCPDHFIVPMGVSFVNIPYEHTNEGDSWVRAWSPIVGLPLPEGLD